MLFFALTLLLLARLLSLLTWLRLLRLLAGIATSAALLLLRLTLFGPLLILVVLTGFLALLRTHEGYSLDTLPIEQTRASGMPFH